MPRVNIPKVFVEAYKETKRSAFLVFLILRALVILTLIRQLFLGEIENAFLCALSLILLLLPSFLELRLAITFPNTLEILIYLFIFSSEILGEINNFYHYIPIWDTMLHTVNGFLCAAVGFSLINLLNERSDDVHLSPFYLSLMAFCFSMTIAVLWEFVEYSGDKFLRMDMQKDTIVTTISTVALDETHSNKPVIINNISETILLNPSGEELAVINGGYLDIGLNDTIKDMFVNFIGAVVFCTFGYYHISDHKHSRLFRNLVPTKGTPDVPEEFIESIISIFKRKR